MQKIKIVLDDKIKKLPLFKDAKEIEVNKVDIFKYGIMNEDVPAVIFEDAFEYFQCKIPAFEMFYSDHIDIKNGVVYNYSSGESKTRISEIIGVGLGLKFFVNLLSIPINTVHKIPASEKKKKYLDFRTETKKGKFELECKGTINESSKGAFLKHINEKKEDNKDIKATRIGTITFARRVGETEESYIYVTDDYLDEQEIYEMNIRKYFMYYSLFLSFALDSTYYNRAYNNFYFQEEMKNNSIKKDKFYTTIEFNGKTYYGECFDRRLCFDKEEINITQKDTIYKILKKLTKVKGIYKYFIGIDERIIDGFNELNTNYFNEYFGSLVNKIQNKDYENGDFTLLGEDGIIFIRKSGDNAKFFDEIFDEEEVAKRLGLYINYLGGYQHECGALCTSWEKKGKPCEILTYREHCHFHR